jgi:hypothetical protein
LGVIRTKHFLQERRERILGVIRTKLFQHILRRQTPPVTGWRLIGRSNYRWRMAKTYCLVVVSFVVQFSSKASQLWCKLSNANCVIIKMTRIFDTSRILHAVSIRIST